MSNSPGSPEPSAEALKTAQAWCDGMKPTNRQAVMVNLAMTLDTFAAQVAARAVAEERERCAKYLDEQAIYWSEMSRREATAMTADAPAQRGRTLTLYRDDSTVQVVYGRVKAVFWTTANTVLVISRYDADSGDGHHYIHWPRERFCWFKDQP